MSQFKREYLVWAVCFVGLIGLPFFSLPTEDVAWQKFADAYCTELTTLFSSNNSASGNTFDITSSGGNSVQITGWLVNLHSQGLEDTISFYWRSGTSNGFENSPDSWTLLGTASGVTSNGSNTPTPVTMPKFTIHAGETFGFYVHSDLGILNYTTDPGGDTEVFSDGNLTLTTYFGKGAPVFTGSTFGFRQWNGTVQYCEYIFLDSFESGEYDGVVEYLAVTGGFPPSYSGLRAR